MRRPLRLLLPSVLAFLVVAAVLYAANTTINPVPDPNTPTGAASYSTDMSRFLTQEDAARQGELPLFVDGVIAQHGGGVHGTSMSMTSPPFATTGYTTAGNRVHQVSASINYSAQTCAAATSTAWVMASAQTLSPLGTFLRVPGTAYYTDCSSGAAVRPTLPADSLWLMKVTLSAGQITAVEDIATRSLDVTATVVDAARFPGDTLGQKVQAALATLPPAGGTVDARRLYRGGLTNLLIDVDMFAGVLNTTPVQVLFGVGTALQTVTQTPPNFAAIVCDGN